MKLLKQHRAIVVVYVVTIALWLLFAISSQYQETTEGYIFDWILKPFLIGMTILPLLGGISGIFKASRWGGSKSILGRGVMSLSLGLITWAGGMAVWNYYLFFTTIEVPYPSLADGLFVLSWPLWSYGIWQLAHTTGVKFELRTTSGKLLLGAIPIITGIISYYLLIIVARGGSIDLTSGGSKVFFDLFYPFGDILLFTAVALLYGLSRKFLGGKFKSPSFILMIGFMVNYITDFIFSYTTTNETYFNGHVVDLLFTTSMFILSIGINALDPKQGK